MAYTPATQYPTNSVLTVFTWARPGAENPRIAQPVSSTATTLTFTHAPKDKDGTVLTLGFLMNAKDNNGYPEIIYVPAGALSADGLTATGVVRGIRPEGLDYTTGDSSFAVDLPQDAPVGCAVAQTYFRMMIATLQGTIASGSTSWKIGDGTDSNVTVYAYNADSNKPFWRYDAATNLWIFSNDGVSSTPFGTGAGVTGGDGITVTAGDIDIDLTDTTIFVSTSSGAGDNGKISRLDSAGKIPLGFIKLATKGDLLTYGSSTAILPVGSTGQSLFVDSIAANGISWRSFPFIVSTALLTSDAGTPTVQDDGSYVSIASGATSGNYTIRYGSPRAAQGATVPYRAFNAVTVGQIFDFACIAQADSTANIDTGIGFTSAPATIVSIASTNDGAAFIWDNSTGKFYSWSSDGTAAQTTDISALVTTTQMNNFRIRWTSGTDVKFYINGTLVATHSTRIPRNNIGSAIAVCFGVKTNTSAGKAIYVGKEAIISV